MTKKINILIVNWKDDKSVKSCLGSLGESAFKEFRVLIINNYSNQDDLIKIRYIYDLFKTKLDLFLIENDTNLGYAGGNNAGLRYLINNGLIGNVLIMNPDVCVSYNTIQKMEQVLTSTIGIVMVRTLDVKLNILYDAIKLNGFFQKNIIGVDEYITTDYAQGSCMLINRDAIEAVGLFDERFFLYWEEVDFSLRTKKAGYKLKSITSTSVIRKNNNISQEPKVFYYSIRNSVLIKQKHPENFTKTQHFVYLGYMLFITIKFFRKPKIFFSTIKNYIEGLIDANNGNFNQKHKRFRNS